MSVRRSGNDGQAHHRHHHHWHTSARHSHSHAAHQAPPERPSWLARLFGFHQAPRQPRLTLATPRSVHPHRHAHVARDTSPHGVSLRSRPHIARSAAPSEVREATPATPRSYVAAAGTPLARPADMPTSIDHQIRHVTQWDSDSCKPASRMMLGGHVGRTEVAANGRVWGQTWAKNIPLTGEVLHGLLSQVQRGGVMTGVLSPYGSPHGHVLVINGYEVVDRRSGRKADDARVEAAFASAGDDWSQLPTALKSAGLQLHFSTRDPATSGHGAYSYLALQDDGRISRGAIAARGEDLRVANGPYITRYFALDARPSTTQVADAR